MYIQYDVLNNKADSERRYKIVVRIEKEGNSPVAHYFKDGDYFYFNLKYDKALSLKE